MQHPQREHAHPNEPWASLAAFWQVVDAGLTCIALLIFAISFVVHLLDAHRWKSALALAVFGGMTAAVTFALWRDQHRAGKQAAEPDARIGVMMPLAAGTLRARRSHWHACVVVSAVAVAPAG